MTTLQVRIDEKLKKAAIKKFEAIGMDLSSGVRVLLSQIVEDKNPPFTTRRTPKETRAEWDKGVAHALKYGKRYTSAKELHDDVLKK